MAGSTRGVHPIYLFQAARWLHGRGMVRLAKCVVALNTLMFRCILPPEIAGASKLGLNHRGLNVVIHPNVTLGRSVHLQHGVTLATDRSPRSAERMLIGNYVSIGVGATVLGPISVGDFAIVGAGSVVTKDVPAAQVWAGNPARYLRDVRPSDLAWVTNIERLLLRARADYLQSVKSAP